jgi:hypothetical protein
MKGLCQCLLALVLLAGVVCCGSSPSMMTMGTPTSSVPVISNMTAVFAARDCIRAADALTGRELVITFNYADSGADISGGRVQLSRSYNTGGSEGHFFAVPSQVTLTGTPMSGQIQVNACPRYADASSSIETITLFDASGYESNRLSVTVNRPPGAP